MSQKPTYLSRIKSYADKKSFTLVTVLTACSTNFSSSKRIFLELVEKYKIPFSERRLQHKETNSGQSRFMSKSFCVFLEFEKVGGSKMIMSYFSLSIPF